MDLGVIALVVVLSVSLQDCGFLGSSGGEPKGDENLPLSGVGPFLKENQDCQATFDQPIFMSSPESDTYWGEPFAVSEDASRFRLFFEERKPEINSPQENTLTVKQQLLDLEPTPSGFCRKRDIIFISASGDPIPGPDPAVVLEGGGAPSVMLQNGRYRMWYGMENGQGIGYAEFLKDANGTLVLQTEQSLAPVLGPSEAWEGGYVGSPSVLRNQALEYYQMWYEGNIFCTKDPRTGEDICHRAIGYATSPDGISWTKRDAAGRTNVDNPGTVEPLLVPTQSTWEYHYPVQVHSGTVGMPHVILHSSPVRTLYYLYYTGNLQGVPEQKAALDPSNDIDTSIGLAGSLDGVNWVKASNIQDFGSVSWEVNPILNEVFPLDVVNKLWVELGGHGYQYKVQGSSNVFFPPVIINEMAPCVLDMGTVFYMFFEQIFFEISFETGGSGSLITPMKGLALAVVERE